MQIDAILFDKDGTLFDFQKTWSRFAMEAIHAFPPAPPEIVAHALGFDIVRGRFHADAQFVSGTSAETAAVLSETIDVPIDTIRLRFDAIGRDTAQVPVDSLAQTLEILSARVLGVATNDAEASARAHLDRVEIAHHFDFVAGYDSGFGSKPGPGQLLAFAKRTGVAPERVLMVGDSRHDLAAANAAGMPSAAVLTGTAGHDDLASLATVVLDSIAGLPDWLAQAQAT